MKPLSTPYVFYVGFRNQRNKVRRCIDSILSQETQLDYGIIVIDDASTDSSLDQIPHINVPCVIFQNPDRLHHPRCLYHSVRKFVQNPDAVIMEMSGDDYLANNKVLEIVSEKHKQGYLQTFGSFKLVGDNYRKDGVGNDGKYYQDVTQPWDLDKCAAWSHLKTYRKELFCKVELDYFLERDTKRWLISGYDLNVYPRMVELANYKACFIPDILYIYDVKDSRAIDNEKERLEYYRNKLCRIPEGGWIQSCE